jgi:hypothetical protein
MLLHCPSECWTATDMSARRTVRVLCFCTRGHALCWLLCKASRKYSFVEFGASFLAESAMATDTLGPLLSLLPCGRWLPGNKQNAFLNRLPVQSLILFKRFQKF